MQEQKFTNIFCCDRRSVAKTKNENTSLKTDLCAIELSNISLRFQIRIVIRQRNDDCKRRLNGLLILLEDDFVFI